MQYLFELGHQPHISTEEIVTLLQHENHEFQTELSQSHLLVTADRPINGKDLQKKLGGTIAIREKLAISPTKELIASYLDTTFQNGKIQFSLHGSNAKKMALEVKKHLKTNGRSIRYIEPKNSATILYNGLVEKKSDLTIHNGAVWVTIAIQDFHKFKERDYDRPATDEKSGMLPPKLARSMINLSGIGTNKTVYDPFCGSGTVLIEALSLGFTSVCGSDISAKAVQDTIQNTSWIKKELSLKSSVLVKEHDITKKISFLKPQSIDAIVSEPYMGKPLHGNESKHTLQTQALELKQLFKRTFSSFHPVLADNGVVIFVIPSFKYGKDWITINCIQDIESVGYKVEPFTSGSFLRYHRPNQHLARDIWKFKKVS